MPTLPIIELTGTPYEQGVQHGRRLRGAIAHNLEGYFHRFAAEAGVPRAEVLVVTTPQRAAQEVAARAAVMAQKTSMRLVGVVENMSGEIFGAGGGARLAEELSLTVSRFVVEGSARLRRMPAAHGTEADRRSRFEPSLARASTGGNGTGSA